MNITYGTIRYQTTGKYFALTHVRVILISYVVLCAHQTEEALSSGAESLGPDFDDVPDEREAMMSRREALVQKQVRDKPSSR